MNHDGADLLLLQAMRLKGRLDPESARRVGGDGAWARVLELAERSLVQASPAGARLTATGRARLAELVAAERATIDAGALTAFYEQRFDGLNGTLKEIVTAWQITPTGAPIDHADASYDEEILERRAALHESVREELSELFRAAPRLGPYLGRLDDAVASAEAGDLAYVAHPLRDSYHQVWFELHEELLALLGRDRVAEAKAGRA